MKSRKVTVIMFPALLFFLMILLSLSVQAADGVISVKSANSCETTADKLVAALKAKGMRIFAQIDHSQGAAKVGLELLPTKVIIFGNPKVGTHLMKCAQSAGIDMPMKALITEDADGNTWYSYNDPAYLAKRHGAEGCEILGKMTKALGAFAAAATNP